MGGGRKTKGEAASQEGEEDSMGLVSRGEGRKGAASPWGRPERSRKPGGGGKIGKVPQVKGWRKTGKGAISGIPLSGGDCHPPLLVLRALGLIYGVRPSLLPSDSTWNRCFRLAVFWKGPEAWKRQGPSGGMQEGPLWKEVVQAALRLGKLPVVQHVVLGDFLVAAEDGRNECGADPHAVSFLAPVDCAGVFVAVRGDFQAPGEGVHDDALG